ncbi:MAG TPA: S-layer homology domain-containing protein, partial [Anaerovoracaceae bacterium]|nr:S-layer homology domain-containing protein [Anaerovoracaceae bacterium]
TYTDVKADAWYADAVAKAAAAGYINGYPDGTMRPDNSISREETATIIMKINKLTENADAASKFTDANTLVWSKGAVGAVKFAGIMIGYPDGSFQPKNYIKRGEAVFALDKSLTFSKNNMIYDKVGTYGPATGDLQVTGNVIVQVKGTVLQNMVISGDLIIDKNVGDGNVTLNNVTVKGETKIYGGSVNSIIVIDSTLGKVTISKVDGKIRIVISGNTTVGVVTANSGVTLEEGNLTGGSEGFQEIIIDSEEGDTIVLVGSFSDVEINTPGLIIDVPAGTTVESMIVNEQAAITGEGVVANAEINVSGVTFETAPAVQDVAPGGMDYEDASVMAFETLEGIPENVSVSEYTVNLKDGWMIGGIAEAGSALFYLNLKPADELEYLEKCELVKINLQSGEEVVEYSFEISGTLWVNELMGTKEDLFWVELGKDWKIKRYNLTSKEISTVKSSDDRSQIIMLSSGDHCISWFEDLPEGKMALYVYDIEKDKIKTISEEIMLLFPYTRARIQDSIVAYVTKPEDSYIVNAYNLKTEELTAQIDVGQEYPGNPAGNQEYLTWCLEPFYGNFDLYAYNIQKGEGIQLNRMEDSTYVFSYDMIGHLILINDRDTNNIICLDMKNGTKANLTAGLGAEHLYIFGQATHNLSYIATEREDNHYKIIKIAILDVTKEAGITK